MLAFRTAAVAAFCAAAFVACHSGSSSVTPLKVGSTAAPSAPSLGTNSVVLAFATPAASSTPAAVTMTALPTNADGSTLTYAQAAAYLPAAQSPGPDAAGTDGFITALTPTSLTVKQVAIAGATDSTGNTIPFVQNYASVGTPGGTITVNFTSSTLFATPDGESDLAVGQEIVAGGTASGSTLAADFVAVVAAAGAQTSSAAQKRVAAKVTRTVAKARALAGAPAGYTAVTNAFTYSAGLLGAVGFSGNGTSISSLPYRCQVEHLLGPQGTASVKALVGGSIMLPQVAVNFPFETDYNPNPPNFMDNDGLFTSPGAMGTWLQFAADPGSAANPTYDIEFQLDASIGLQLTDSCTNHTYLIAGFAVGYSYSSNTAQALPGPNQTVKLTAVNCIGANGPVQITLPIGGGLSWLQNLGQVVGLQVCGLPTITGGLVQATVPTSPTGGIFSGSNVIFDPSMTGGASVSSAPLLNPTAAVVSFPISNWMYSPVYTDGQLIQLTFLNRPIISLGTCDSFPSCLSDGTASGVPFVPSFQRTYTASPSPIRISTGIPVTCVHSSPATDQGCFIPLDDPNAESPPTNPVYSATVTVSESGYTGTFTWNPAAPGYSSTAGPTDNPTCTESYFAAALTVSPQSGTSFTFTQTQNLFGAEPPAGNQSGYSEACYGIISDTNGNFVLVEPYLEGWTAQGVPPPALRRL